MSNEPTIISTPVTEAEIDNLATIESLFFAYRDFVADPDRILEQYGFGRAHHRVLFFVNRKPGMTVAELLDILKITKQSLARVLRQLIEAEYVAQNEGSNDRRKRLLYPTNKGRELVLKLSNPQSVRIAKAAESLSPETRKEIIAFLGKMANPQQ